MINRDTIAGLYSRLKTSPLFKDSFWALFGNAIGKGLSLLAGIAVARFLGNDVYGEYGMIKSTFVLIAIFSSFGLGYTATKFIAECRGEDAKKVGAVHSIATTITLCVSAAIALLVIIFSNRIAILLDAPHLGGILRLSAVAIVFNAVNTTQTGELAGFNAYRIIAVNNTIVGVFTFVVSILFAYYYSLAGAIFALMLSFALNCSLNFFVLRKKFFHKRVRVSNLEIKRYTKEIFKFSLPVALQESLYSITHWGSMIVMIKVAGYGELGLSSAAGQWMAVLLFVPGALRNVALSYLSGSNTDARANNRILNRLLAVNFVSTFLPSLIVAIFSNWVCSWYGPTYVGLQQVLNITIFTVVINSMTNVYTQEFMAHGMNWYLFWSRFIRDCLILLATYYVILIYGHGAFVYAVISLLGQSLYLLILFVKYRCMYKHEVLVSK